MHFTKAHGLGNDFILVDCFKEKVNPEDFPGLAVKMCDRHFGVGADGLVLLLPSPSADVSMRIFNPDGSEAEMCGNAIRCVAKYLYERGMVKADRIRVETLAGVMIPELLVEEGRVRLVRVDMGEPRLERSEIPMEGPPGRVLGEPLETGGAVYRITAVSMGNPHCVIFVQDLDAVPFQTAGPLIETHPAFPRRTNVEFIQVLTPEEIKMRVWERGAGETMACGTGACAAVVAGVLNGYTGRRVTVHLKAGDLFIEWPEGKHVYMSGPAEEVFSGEYPYRT
ncbi:MAG: diaminopimelate epimerase [Pelotomaculum sp.]|uniref:Diaminopimelate epimerase n=1 Tax=Pelotomaculum thermopropionicum (strain DSM 13744 / JCM 10971 / SI) TaxID=370438 RepID=DAPF_PELTS|nr:RecName: Full=Diaminopimelate epimerase; Short=DAP epimerase; AltName: Full=PLP-independent amino acid racemase [Pelotomaculum thermopropionicum SI]NPV72766.1 diaminopimelate epimerase [Pelotomaculum sp.]BAF59981.1 diaminopimelate epimerase [Pelotomaculum thermopropionicum SI]